MTWLFFGRAGRIGRKLFVLGWLLLTAVNGFLLGMIFGHEEGSDALAFWSTVSIFVGVLTIWTSAMLTVKRLHDLNAAGMLAVMIFVPLVSIFLIAALAIWPGTAGPNNFGDPPPA